MEILKSVDQNRPRALQEIDARPNLFARAGAVVASWRYHAGQKLGPYFRLAYREDGRQRSLYLGRAGALVDAVRQRLAALQRPLREHRWWNGLMRSARAGLRAHKVLLRRELQRHGLRLHGNEFRGWRTSPFRHLMREARAMCRLPTKELLGDNVRFRGETGAMSLQIDWPKPPPTPRAPSISTSAKKILALMKARVKAFVQSGAAAVQGPSPALGAAAGGAS